ncbi:hypothetical protein LXL04_031296 [Taraxacum kok-saghyz]
MNFLIFFALQLDGWSESVNDYEVLRRELPNYNHKAESLFHAQVALKNSLMVKLDIDGFKWVENGGTSSNLWRTSREYWLQVHGTPLIGKCQFWIWQDEATNEVAEIKVVVEELKQKLHFESLAVRKEMEELKNGLEKVKTEMLHLKQNVYKISVWLILCIVMYLMW